MKGFELDSTGDVLIVNNRIPLVSGPNLLLQKVQNVLGTNKGEWFLDLEEGIDFDNLLGKGVTEDLVRYEIEQGLLQVDSTFTITEFTCDIDNSSRKIRAHFKAQVSNGEEVEGEYAWA